MNLKKIIQKTLLSTMVGVTLFTPNFANAQSFANDDLNKLASSPFSDMREFYINYKYVTPRHRIILNTKMGEPNLKVVYNGQVLNTMKGINSHMYEQELLIRNAWKKHMHQLKSKDINFKKIPQHHIYIDFTYDEIAKQNGKNGTFSGLYSPSLQSALSSPFHVPYVKDRSIVIKGLNKPNNSSFTYEEKVRLKQTLMHEFGHLIGNNIYHKNRDFREFRAIRKYIYADYSKYWGTLESWVNSDSEQFAESYVEYFFEDGYKNKTVVPNMTQQQKNKFIQTYRRLVDNM